MSTDLTEMYNQMEDELDSAMDEVIESLSADSSSEDEVEKASGEFITKATDEKYSKALKYLIGRFFKSGRIQSLEKVEELLSEVRSDLTERLKAATNSFFNRVYNEEVEQVERQLGVNITFDSIDEEAVRYLKSQPVLQQSFNDLSKNVADKIQQVLLSAYSEQRGIDLNRISKEIEEVAGVAESRAELIARTETSKVSAAARKNSYAKEEEARGVKFKYRWIGPTDGRTTDLSKRIKRRTSGGVTYDEMINIIQEESRKDFPEWTVDPNAPVSHYQSRHTFVRVVE